MFVYFWIFGRYYNIKSGLLACKRRFVSLCGWEVAPLSVFKMASAAGKHTNAAAFDLYRTAYRKSLAEKHPHLAPSAVTDLLSENWEVLDTKERGDWLAKAISLKRAHEFAAAEKRKREKDERKYLSLKHPWPWEMRKLAAEKRYAEKKREKLRLENEALDNKNKELGKRKRKELEEERISSEKRKRVDDNIYRMGYAIFRKEKFDSVKKSRPNQDSTTIRNILSKRWGRLQDKRKYLAKLPTRASDSYYTQRLSEIIKVMELKAAKKRKLAAEKRLEAKKKREKLRLENEALENKNKELEKQTESEKEASHEYNQPQKALKEQHSLTETLRLENEALDKKNKELEKKVAMLRKQLLLREKQLEASRNERVDFEARHYSPIVLDHLHARQALAKCKRFGVKVNEFGAPWNPSENRVMHLSEGIEMLRKCCESLTHDDDDERMDN